MFSGAPVPTLLPSEPLLALRSANQLRVPGFSARRLEGVAATTTENRVAGNFGTVSGGANNTSSGEYATVGGGQLNVAGGFSSVVAGGEFNSTGGLRAAVGGGEANSAGGNGSTIGGGKTNASGGSYSTIGGGDGNTAGGSNSVISGGENNTAGGSDAAIGGGEMNVANGSRATVAGGYHNTSTGSDSTVEAANRTWPAAPNQRSAAAGSTALPRNTGPWVGASVMGPAVMRPRWPAATSTPPVGIIQSSREAGPTRPVASTPRSLVAEGVAPATTLPTTTAP